MLTGTLKVIKLFSKLLLVIFCALCCFVFQTVYQTYKVEQASVRLSEIKKEKEDKESNELLQNINPEYKGWLRIQGTNVDYPVVMGTDNEKYLNIDFYGDYSKAGTLFFDKTTDFSVQGNRIIYGHKMKDNTMFGTIDRYKDKDFFKNNGYVTLEDINGKHIYKIFAAMVVSGNSDSSSFINIQEWNNRLTETAKENMLITIEHQSSIFQKPFKTKDDTFLFLVTCDYTENDGRLVLVARSIATERGDM